MLLKNRKLLVLNFVLIFVLIIRIDGGVQAAGAILIVPDNYLTIQATIDATNPVIPSFSDQEL